MKNYRVLMIIVLAIAVVAFFTNSIISDMVLQLTIAGNKPAYELLIISLAVINFTLGYVCGQTVIIGNKRKFLIRQIYVITIVSLLICQIGLVLLLNNIITNSIEVPVVIVKYKNIFLFILGFVVSLIPVKIYSSLKKNHDIQV